MNTNKNGWHQKLITL